MSVRKVHMEAVITEHVVHIVQHIKFLLLVYSEFYYFFLRCRYILIVELQCNREDARRFIESS